MKRLFLILCLIACLTISVSADILWEPLDNDYYRKHYMSAQGIDRKYVVPEGMTVDVYTAPEGGKLMKTLEAGTRVYVGFSMELDGEIWAVGYPLGDYQTEGWFRLGRLQLEYDHEMFMENFSGQVKSTDLSYDVENFTESIPTWTYPGSGVSAGVIDAQWMSPDYNDGKLTIDRVYTDPDGGEWGYVGYYMGRYGWAYLTDLHEETPPTYVQTPESTVTDTAQTEEAPSGNLSTILILVGAVVLGTAVVIAVVKKKGRMQNA